MIERTPTLRSALRLVDVPDGERTYVFGRRDDCDVVVENDEYVSPYHCAVWQTERGDVFVADLGSTNGTRLRMQSAVTLSVALGSPLPVHPGDALLIGRTRIPWTAR